MTEGQRKDLLAVIITFVVVLLGVLFVGWVNSLAQSMPFALRLVLPIVVWWPMLIPAMLFMRRDKETAKDIGFAKEKVLRQILAGVLVAIGSLAIFIVLPALFGFQTGYVGSVDALSILYQFLYMMLAVALVEEIIFRGHLFKKLFDMTDSKWFAIIASSALFGILHIFSGGFLQIILTAAMGIYWCVCREKIKHCTLLALIVAHALHNTIHPIITALFFG
ncbi:MAG: CPBP family intramembrane metalloprotease [Clostridiales bacterium]|nr:CPBP family intramembrane metalloprotease [Clostridiales bacterium]